MEVTNGPPALKATQMMLTGVILGALHRDEGLLPFLALSGADIEKDEDGNYLPFFYLTHTSGTRLKVSVEVEE